MERNLVCRTTFSLDRVEEKAPPSNSTSRVIRKADRFNVDCSFNQTTILLHPFYPLDKKQTHLKCKLLQGIRKSRERLVPRPSLSHQRQSPSRTASLAIGNLDTSRIRDFILQPGSRSRSHATTGHRCHHTTLLLQQRTGSRRSDRRPRQHIEIDARVTNVLGTGRIGNWGGGEGTGSWWLWFWELYWDVWRDSLARRLKSRLALITRALIGRVGRNRVFFCRHVTPRGTA